jgi:phage-related protein
LFVKRNQPIKWKITYYNQSVKDDAGNFPSSIKAKYEAILDKILEYGPNLGMPFTKPFGNGLFEMRAKGSAGIARGFFCTITNNTVVILHVIIKKTQATPKKELDLAKKRMNEVKRHDI